MPLPSPPRQPRPPPAVPSTDPQPSSPFRDPNNSHAPLVPSSLRQSHEPGASSPDAGRSESGSRGAMSEHESRSLGRPEPENSQTTRPVFANGLDREENGSPSQPNPTPGDRPNGVHTHSASAEHDERGIQPPSHGSETLLGAPSRTAARGILDEPEDHGDDATQALLESYNDYRACGCDTATCQHGTWSPRPATAEDSFRDTSSTNSKRGYRWSSISQDIRERFKSSTQRISIGDNSNGTTQRQNTRYLATQHGLKHGSRMYLGYYFPFLSWIGQYRWAYLRGDFVAALTMASFYIPMALSYAENLGHVPPIHGLYSFVFNPLIYAFLGTVPQMVVGPEAAGSLLVGTVVRSSVKQGHSSDDEGLMHARIAGIVTFMAGTIILVAGLTRLGFLESVLSRPFLRGFISAIGIVIFVGQLIPETGLNQLAHRIGVDHESTWNQLVFLFTNLNQAHGPTAAVSFGSFAIIMICRQSKLMIQPKRPWVAFIPDRFLVVVLSAVFAYAFDWELYGIEILGKVKSSTGNPFPAHFPLIPSYMIHVREALSTSFLIALLGFFESSVAAKSLDSSEKKPGEGIRGIQHSANRELVALGVANAVGGCFMSLPAFGGYGRSKVNASTGGKTPMSSILLSLFTAITVVYLLPWLYYIPEKGVLSAMISVVAYSLIEECPHDIAFFLRIGGWQELTLMFLIFFATIFYSLTVGIALGMGLSLLAVIRHATKPRIQILGKIPGTANQFENAETNPHDVEFIEGSLIIKIPEPLTFANTGDLRNRLRRLEHYGTMKAHPALPRVRSTEHNQNIIFDVHGVTSLDGSGTQVLSEIVAGYVNSGVRVFFCRVPSPRHPVFRLFMRSGIVEKAGGMRHFVMSVEEALALAAETNEESEFRDQEQPPV